MPVGTGQPAFSILKRIRTLKNHFFNNLLILRTKAIILFPISGEQLKGYF